MVSLHVLRVGVKVLCVSGHAFVLGTLSFLGMLSALKTDGFTFIGLLEPRANGCSRARKVFLRTHREQWRV